MKTRWYHRVLHVDSNLKLTMVRILTQLAILISVASMAFWFGQKRTEYIYTRGCIRLNLYSQAKLDAGHPELVKRDIDTMIRAYYRDMHLIPAWIPFFGPDREPDSTEEIAKRAAELKTVLDRTNSAPTDLAEVVRFVRTYMGTHSSYAAPQSLSDFIKNETQKKTSQ